MFDNGINTGDLFSKYEYVFFPVDLCFPRFLSFFFPRYTFASYTAASKCVIARRYSEIKKKKKIGRTSQSQHLRYNSCNPCDK